METLASGPADGRPGVRPETTARTRSGTRTLLAERAGRACTPRLDPSTAAGGGRPGGPCWPPTPSSGSCSRRTRTSRARGCSPAALPVWVLINKLVGLYDRDANLIHKSTLDEFPQHRAVDRSRHRPRLHGRRRRLPASSSRGLRPRPSWRFALLTVPVLRSAVRGAVVRRFPPERCVIVGLGLRGRPVARKIAVHPEYGVKLVGFVDVPYPGNAERQRPSRQPAGRPGPLRGDLHASSGSSAS